MKYIPRVLFSWHRFNKKGTVVEWNQSQMTSEKLALLVNEYDRHSVYVLYGRRLFGGVIYKLV